MPEEHHHHSHGLGHSAAGANASRLAIVFGITVVLMAVEVAGGLFTGSLALIADAGHMLTDAIGIGLALVAVRLATRPATARQTYGYYRLEILAALVNGLLMFGIGAYILVEAYLRFGDPPEVNALPMLGVAAAGLVFNMISASLLMEGQKTSLNLRGAFLEVISDLLGSVAVIIAGIVLLTTGFKLIDPIASVVIGLFILPRTYHLTRDALHVLLEGVPANVDIAELRQHILEVPNVTGVHDLHVWSLTSGIDVISAHVVVQPTAEANQVLDDLCSCLGQHFDIEHSTFQIEQKDRVALEHASH